MATKSITIDIEAYNRLKGVQHENESFSQTIKRVVPPPFDLDAWLEKVSTIELGEDMIASVEEQVAGRSQRSRRR